MDRWRPRLWNATSLAADRRRDLYDIHFPGSQWLGVFQGWSSSLHFGLPTIDERGGVLHSAAGVGSWKKTSLETQADFFHVRYNNKYLAAFVALVGVVCIIPYLQLQLTGLGMIVEVASYGVIQERPR